MPINGRKKVVNTKDGFPSLFLFILDMCGQSQQYNVDLSLHTNKLKNLNNNIC